MHTQWLQAFSGGMLIGLSASLMLLLHGRITGISGILNGILDAPKSDRLWRFLFISGLVLGGIALSLAVPDSFEVGAKERDGRIVVAGVLVGFGTILGNGCTSGHGVCGISRMSRRSLIATASFMISGIGTIALLRLLGGGL